MPAMKIILTFLSDGSFNELAMETKNASMASPIPSKMLLIKKESSRNMGCILPHNPVLNQKINISWMYKKLRFYCLPIIIENNVEFY